MKKLAYVALDSIFQRGIHAEEFAATNNQPSVFAQKASAALEEAGGNPRRVGGIEGLRALYHFADGSLAAVYDGGVKCAVDSRFVMNHSNGAFIGFHDPSSFNSVLDLMDQSLRFDEAHPREANPMLANLPKTYDEIKAQLEHTKRRMQHMTDELGIEPDKFDIDTKVYCENMLESLRVMSDLREKRAAQVQRQAGPDDGSDPDPTEGMEPH